MRTATIILLVGVTAMLLGCGLLGDSGQVAEESEAGASSQATMVGPFVAPSAGSMIAYDGPSSLEERILKSPVIARVRLDSATSTVESGTIFDGSTKYMVILEFSFSVLEYLKGSGANDIVAVWDADPVFDTRQEAEAALPAIVAARDTQWDDREAIVFLQTPRHTSRARSRRDAIICHGSVDPILTTTTA